MFNVNYFYCLEKNVQSRHIDCPPSSCVCIVNPHCDLMAKERQLVIE